MLRSTWTYALFFCFFVCPAFAETRIALIIGNGAYETIGRLPNPPADARLMSDTLQRVGFDVTLLEDAGQDAMKREIANFGRALRRAGPEAVGLFYFAGHGVQSDGQNYLIPTGADILDEADLDVFSIEADWVLRQMASNAGGTNIVILDACRNNPFESSFRSASRGLARMGAPNGSFVAYATAPGDVAYDGKGRHSPYTAALSRAILEPGKPIEQVFKSVRIDVLSETGGAQTPWDSSSLTRDFLFSPAIAQPIALAPSGPSADERALWERVRNSANADQIGLYLSLYPDGAFAAEAAASKSSIDAAAQQKREDAADAQSQLAALAPQQSVSATPVDDIEILFEFDFHSTGGGYCLTNKYGPSTPARVALDGVRRRVTGQTGEYQVAAWREGSGATISIAFSDDDQDDAVLVAFDNLAPGASKIAYPNKRYAECGRATLYVNIVE
ncbi:MAG: caspase family protein [Pseudomonadota bacterium]